MAQRWLFEEDYIVCKFCKEKESYDIVGELLDELMTCLSKAGFEPRSKESVKKRARDFTCLLRGWDSPYATDQVLKVYETVSGEQQMMQIYLYVVQIKK